jgi:putative colanic acid biosynthesis acetyltransferase WcaF
MHGWRTLLLRLLGAKIHSRARVYSRARVWAPWNLEMGEGACIGDDVDVYCVARITVGAWATVSQYSYLCAATHDHEDPDHPLVAAPIEIGTRAWLAADVFVGPGVRIGEGTVVGARSAVFRDLPAWVIAVGTPAKPVGERRLRRTAGATPAPEATGSR